MINYTEEEVKRGVIDVLCYGLSYRETERVKAAVFAELDKRHLDLEDISYKKLLDIVREHKPEDLRQKQLELTQ